MIFGAFILTYRRPEYLRRSIEFVLEQTRRPDQIWVIDNADDPATRDVVASFAGEGIRYHATERNLGSAGGVATGFELLAAAGCDWILSLDDDDTQSTDDTQRVIEDLVALIERASAASTAGGGPAAPLGIVGIAGARFDWTTGEHRRIPTSDLVGDLEVDIIGGGSFLTLSRHLIADIGPPNKAFFFGHYDPLYCLEARQRGYRVMVGGDLMRASRAFTGRLDAKPVRRTLVSTWPPHSLWRRYYVTRNYIYAMRGTLGAPRLARRMALKGLVQSVLAFGRGPRYGWRYATMQLRGIVDGYRGRLGPTILPVPKPLPAIEPDQAAPDRVSGSSTSAGASR